MNKGEHRVWPISSLRLEAAKSLEKLPAMVRMYTTSLGSFYYYETNEELPKTKKNFQKLKAETKISIL